MYEDSRRDNGVFSAEVDFDVYLTMTDLAVGREWPPRRFERRDARLLTLSRLWRGEYQHFVDARKRWIVGPNPFRSYSTKLGNFLSITAPESPALDATLLFDSIVDLTRYGGAVLRQIDGVWCAEEVPSWYPMLDGDHVFVRRFISATADIARADRIEFEFGGVRRIHEMDSESHYSSIGALLSEESIDAGEVRVVARPPSVGEMWGTSAYLTAAPLAVEVATRLSRNSRVLDLFGQPLAQFRMSDVDAAARYVPDGVTGASEVRELINEGLESEIERNPYRINDATGSLEFVQPSVSGVSNALEQVAMLAESVERELGLPQLDEAGETHSGEALKRLFVHFYGESRSLQNQVASALGIEWLHPFDSFFDGAVGDSIPQEPTRLDVRMTGEA